MSMDLQGIRVTKSTETHRTLASITNEIKISSGFLGHSFDPAKMNGLTSPHDEGKNVRFPFHSGLFMTLKITPSLLGFLHSVSPNSILAFFCLCFICIPVFGGSKPNVLFIAIDDLNDWVGCLDGHPQTRTPNLDRLAASGVLFDNAHCPAPACNPSRTAVFTGLSPHVSGLYRNEQRMRDALPRAELLPKSFSKAGYWSGGSGKMLHYFIDAPSWDEYFPPKETENPFPKTLGPPKRPVSLPRGGPWQYYETDWGPIDGTDEEYGGDYAVAEWVGERLSEKREQPFFLACGIYRPHEPWFVPRKYFEAFPLDEIQLPPGYRPDDLNDLTPRGKALARNRYFEHIQAHKQWKPAIQGYLASIHFADAMLGRILDALEEGPNAENTIVVLWSDHGWHLGEKEHWQKFTLWRVCTRVPLVVRVPKGTPGLPAGTIPSVCSKPVNLLSLAPTLFELCELAPSPLHDGPSLVPLLGAGDSDWPHPSVTHLHDPGSFGLSDESWRYIRYSNGEEELYDLKKDPYEWNNLAMDDGSESQLQRLREKAPSKFAKLFEPNLSELTNLTWEALDPHENPPSSSPQGTSFAVRFANRSKRMVELFWIDPQGNPKPYGRIKPGEVKNQRTRIGAVWMVAQANGLKEKRAKGFFRIEHARAKAEIPSF